MPQDAFTPELLQAVRAEMGQNATDSQWSLFVELCRVRNLIPGRDVVLQLRNAKEWDAALGESVKVKKVTLITTIDAYRKLAERTGLYGGRKPIQWYYLDSSGEPTKVSTIPLGVPPHAAVVRVIRKGWDEPLENVARYDAYVQMMGFGPNRTPTQMWQTRGEEQLAKCAEAGALRAAFPEELGNVYIREELPADEETLVQTQNVAPAHASAPPQAIVAPAVNQNPAPETKPPAAEPVLSAPPEPEPSFTEVRAKCDEMTQQEVNFAVNTVVDMVSAQHPEAGKAVENAQLIANAANPENERLPNPNEFGAFTARASKLMRETLPKAGIKAAADAFKAYTARVSGQGKSLNTKKLTVAQWESLLSAVEKAPIDQVAVIVKGKV